MRRKKRIALVGLGKSNIAVGEYLFGEHTEIWGFDRKTLPELGDLAPRAAGFAAELVLGPNYLDAIEGFDEVFITPGMKKSLPQLVRAQTEGAVLTTEINLLFERCKAPIIGVTGSAGKTTTVSLLGRILKNGLQTPVYVGGNIGTPLIALVDSIEPNALAVLELSSFQLQLLRKSPSIGAVLNISENHLDIHDSMAEYVESKKNVFRFGDSDSWAVLNADDPLTRRMAEEAPAKVALFSLKERVRVGSFVDSRRIVFSSGEELFDCGSVDKRHILGRHNLQNILAATTIAMLAGAYASSVGDAVSRFRGVEHRLEFVGNPDGVRYYNDSIATAPDRTLAALETIRGPIVLIAGGYDKGNDFTQLAQAMVGSLKALVLLGDTREKLLKSVRAALALPREHSLRDEKIVLAESLPDALEKARAFAQPGDAVLLSPACASFGMFTNYEQRGKAFKQLVEKM